MNIGIDIDDTITNLSEIFIKYAREYNKLKKFIIISMLMSLSNLWLLVGIWKTKKNLLIFI